MALAVDCIAAGRYCCYFSVEPCIGSHTNSIDRSTVGRSSVYSYVQQTATPVNLINIDTCILRLVETNFLQAPSKGRPTCNIHDQGTTLKIVSYTASSKLRTIESVTANEMASCDWLSAPALLNTSYWSVIYWDKKPKQASSRALTFEYIIATHYH